MLAASAAGVVSDFLSIIDSMAEPKHFPESWTGVQLVDAEPAANSEPFQELLHDNFWGTYWDWRKIRSQKDWKLDIYEG